MTIGNKQIHPAVVVVVEKLRPPANVWQARGRDLRSIRKIRKRILAVVMIERVVLVCEVRNEQVEFSIVIVVANGHAHTTLFAAILVDGSPGIEPDLLKRSVAFVPVMKIGR